MASPSRLVFFVVLLVLTTADNMDGPIRVNVPAAPFNLALVHSGTALQPTVDLSEDNPHTGKLSKCIPSPLPPTILTTSRMARAARSTISYRALRQLKCRCSFRVRIAMFPLDFNTGRVWESNEFMEVLADRGTIVGKGEQTSGRYEARRALGDILLRTSKLVFFPYRATTEIPRKSVTLARAR